MAATNEDVHADSYSISRATPDDADAIATCTQKNRETSYMLRRIYPQERAHLTTAEEFHNWRVKTLRKMMTAEDLLYFKATTKPNDDEPEKVVGYAAWWMPGHFLEGKTLLQTVSNPSIDVPASNPSIDVASNGVEDTEMAKTKDAAVEPPKDDSPACTDVAVRKDIASRVDQRRKALWGNDANFWYLGAMGVDPDHRRRGIASRLMREGLDRADREGVPAYLEASPDGALMYPNFGFRKVDEEIFFEGKYIMEFHVRPAQSKT